MNQNDRIYRRVIGTIEMNSDNQYQAEWVGIHTVKSILCANGTLAPDAVDRVLDAAVENGDVRRDGDRVTLAEGVTREY